jgi:glycine cleavage system H protein
MAAKSYEIPDDCRYTRTDEWVRVDRNEARIGITDYAQSELSDIVFVELPEPRTQLEKGDALGVVESVKAVADLYAPLTGEVVQVHQALSEHPEWINEEPYGRGWIAVLAVEDAEELDALLSPEEYRKYVEERAGK